MSSDRPPWLQLTRKMYDDGGLWTDQEMERFLENELEVGGFEAGTVTSKLKDWGIIEDKTEVYDGFKEVEIPQYTLTDHGFRVIHEREMNKQHVQTNRVLAIFTALLFLTALIQAQVAYLSLPFGQQAVFTIFIVLLLAGMTFMLRQYGVL